MKVQVEDVSSTEKRLSIEVEPTVVEKELSAAYAALARQVKLPGFRPGKVPRRILEQRYKTDVEADVVRRVQYKAFVDAAREKQVPVVGDPQMSGGSLKANEPFAFTARVEVKPQVKLETFKELKLKKFDAAISDEKVDEQLDRLRHSRTSLEKVEGRDTVQAGDFAVIDFDATLGGQPFAGNTGRDVTVEVTEGQLVQGNLPQLEGAKVGEQKTFDYTFPADYRLEEVKGKTAQFTATVKELKTKKVPELDDELAKAMGAESLEAMKTKVREDLERAEKNRTVADEREDIFKALIAANPFDVPSSMVERGVDMMLEGALGSMARSGVDPRMLNLDWKKMRDELRPRSETEVRGQLLLEALWTQEKLEATAEELDQKLEALANDGRVPLMQLRKQYAGDEGRDALKNRVLEDKALALIRQHAKYD